MRYFPLQEKDRAKMLEEIGVNNIDELFSLATNEKIFQDFDLPQRKNEAETIKHFKELAKKNKSTEELLSFLGGGYYKYDIPSSLDYIIQRGEFMTSYTPYQPEIAQGTLQYLFEFQTQVANLLGMDCANASMWDGATACAEAILMASRITKKNKALLSGNLHPHYQQVGQTYADIKNIELEISDISLENPIDLYDKINSNFACVVVQYPDFTGSVTNYKKIAEKCKQENVLFIAVFTNVVAFGLLENLGKIGADIVVGEGQALGNALNFGGPGLGLMACNKKHIRQMPGRFVGETIDNNNKRAFTLTLSTREQHIRREKATSNICTNSGLCSLAFSIHLSLLGSKGLKTMAKIDHTNAIYLYKSLKNMGIKILNTSFYNEFVIEVPEQIKSSKEFINKMLKMDILAGIALNDFYTKDKKELENKLLITTTAIHSKEDLDKFIQAVAKLQSN